MLAKKTARNRITLPKAVLMQFSGVDSFEVSTDGKCIVLRPLQPSRADEVRARLARIGIKGSEVTSAVKWARKRRVTRP